MDPSTKLFDQVRPAVVGKGLVPPSVAETGLSERVPVFHREYRRSKRSDDFNPLLKLEIAPFLSISERPVHGHVGLDAVTFDTAAVPGYVSSHGDHKPIAKSKLECAMRIKPTGCFHSHEGSETVFFGKLCDHFRGAGAVLIDHNHDLAVKLTRAAAFGFDDHTFFFVVSHREWQDPQFRFRNAAEVRKPVGPASALFCAFPIEAVADRAFVRSQIAHEPNASESAAGIASKIDNKSLSRF